MSRRLLLLAGTLASLKLTSGAEAAQAFDMAHIPSASILLGSNMTEIILAAETCARWADDPTTNACAPEHFTDELSPERSTHVRGFLLDKREVSVAEYARCVKAARCAPPRDPRRIEPFRSHDVPVVFVRQTDAVAYCRFRQARLPSEQEWELASRGPSARRYPWGRDFHRSRANVGRSGVRVTDHRDGFELLAPTPSFPDGRTKEGVLHLGGNAAEWTSTPYALHQADAPPVSGHFVVKGGSFMTAPTDARGAARQSVAAGTRSPDIGFRCARDAFPTSSDSD